MARDNKPGHGTGKVSGGSRRGIDRNPDREKATDHAHSYDYPDGQGNQNAVCSCGEHK